MGNNVSRGTLDVIFILFPFVLSAGLIISIVVCWWKCKLFFDRRRPEGKSQSHHGRMAYPDEPDFGHLINIQEYAENQVGTTIVYDDAPGSLCPHPYVYFSDGRITRIVPLTPSPTYSSQHPDHSHSSCPSALLCNNLPRPNNNHSGDHNGHCYHQNNHNNHKNYQYHEHGQVQLLLHPNHSGGGHVNPPNNICQTANIPEVEIEADLDHDVQCTVTNVTTSTSLTPESREHTTTAEGMNEDTAPLEVKGQIVDLDCDNENNPQPSLDNISANLSNDPRISGVDKDDSVLCQKQ